MQKFLVIADKTERDVRYIKVGIVRFIAIFELESNEN